MKRYTAFLSSTYKDLKNERAEAIGALMDNSIIPIGMEHFATSSSGFFEKIKELIDLSDFFILILGGSYGFCDEDGISITEKEFLYAKESGKTYYVLRADSYLQLVNRCADGKALTDEEKKQLAFGSKIFSSQDITEDRPISRIITQIIAGTDFSRFEGWERQSVKARKEWENNHRIFDLDGTWYHVHLKKYKKKGKSEESVDKDYIRIGTVTIKQDFTPSEYRHLYLNAKNYDVSKVDMENHKLKRDTVKKTLWSGEYFIRDDHSIIGVYKTERLFRGSYLNKEIGEVRYWGVHKFQIEDPDEDNDCTDETVMLSGTFNDIDPKPAKSGHLYLFRTPEARFRFLEEQCPELLEKKRG